MGNLFSKIQATHCQAQDSKITRCKTIHKRDMDNLSKLDNKAIYINTMLKAMQDTTLV